MQFRQFTTDESLPIRTKGHEHVGNTFFDTVYRLEKDQRSRFSRTLKKPGLSRKTFVRREALETIRFREIRANGYAFQMEINYRLNKHCTRVKEISFFFLDRTRGTSKLNVRIALETIWLAWWLRIADLLGRL